MIFGLPCTMCQLPHLILAASLILSAIKAFRFHVHCKVFFHTGLGLMLLVFPRLIHGPMISGGQFDAVHVLLQRYTAPFHIGFALFHYLSAFHHKANGVNATLLFSKALTAAFVLLNKLISAYLLYDQRVRGNYVSKNFLGCTLVLDGIWLLVELYSLIYASKGSVSNEIELMCARTRRWIGTGHSSANAQRAFFWMDATICFFCAMCQFAFAEQLLKFMIHRDHIITELHAMYAREFACQCLAPAILSLVASAQFTLGQQKHYIAQRILCQTIGCALSGWAHFGTVGGGGGQLLLFSANHTVPFVLSFFHCALLFVIWQRVHEEEIEALEEGSDNGVVAGGVMSHAQFSNAGPGRPSSATRVFRSTTTTVQKEQ